MINGSLSLQSEHSILVGAASLSLGEDKFLVGRVVLDNRVLDGVTLLCDEVEDVVGT